MRVVLRFLAPAVGLFTIGPSSPSHAAWQPEGVAVCQQHCGDYPKVAPDGTGGAFVLWRDLDPQTGYDFYLQRKTASGETAPGWPGELAVANFPESQHPGGIAPDGTGGLIVTWQDFRDQTTTGPDIYAQRILADGSLAPGWAVDGMPVSRAPGSQDDPQTQSDGAGGVFVAWGDGDRNYIYAQRLTGSGLPAPGWPADGLPVCTDPGQQSYPLMTSDGAGGIVVAWGDLRDGQGAVYAQRVTAQGQTLWPENGQRLILGRYIRNLVPDDAGGVYLSSTGVTQTPFGFDSTYYVQRFTAAGDTAPGWPAQGVPVCVGPSYRFGLQMVADGAGGALLSWTDLRDYYVGSELYMQRVRPDGTLYPGWTVDGLRLTHNYLNEWTRERDGSLAADGIGGAYACYIRGGTPTVLHVTGTGEVAAGWPAEGWPVSSASSYYGEYIASDGQGGALAAWDQLTNQLDDVRVQRYGMDGPVAVELSLASAEATPERVTLTWQGPSAGSLVASVHRRSVTGGWMRLGAASPNGADRLRYEDWTIAPGARYAYRLGWQESGTERFSAETWVEVPRALEVALAGFRPNPASGTPTVAFTLADAAPGSLEVLDVSGRRTVSREVGSLGPGSHSIRLDGTALAPGVYWLRLQQSGVTKLVRGLVVR